MEPKVFSTVKYTDTNNNGFIDELAFDLDGDTLFEHTVSLLKMGLDDKEEVIKTAGLTYQDLVDLNSLVSEKMWQKACEASSVAEAAGINLSWYSLMRNPKSIQQKYNYGFWLQFYIYHDLMEFGFRRQNQDFLNSLDKAYFSGNWKLVGKL